MRIHRAILKRSYLLAALCIVAVACGLALVKADPPPTSGGPRPKVVLDAGTQ